MLCIFRMKTWFAIVLLLSSHCFLIQGQVCLPEPGDKVITMCENSFNNGNSLYLDTFRAVSYQGSCTCQLTTQGGAVDLQISARGNQTDCDTTLIISPNIEYAFRCVGTDPMVASGKIEPAKNVYVTLTKSSPEAKAAMCVHFAQVSFGGSLSLLCYPGTLKPPTTTRAQVTAPTSTPSPTTRPNSPATRAPATTVAPPVSSANPEPVCQSSPGDKVVNMCERSFGSGTAIYLDTFKAVNYQGSCMCQLRAQGGAVDLQYTVHGASSECDATLYFSPSIDHTYNCADKTPANTTGRIETGQIVYLTLTKGSDTVADFCVLLVQTSSGAGSLSLNCNEGSLKPTTTPRVPVTSTPRVPGTTAGPVTNSTGSQVTTSTSNITTSAGSGQTSTTSKMVTVQKPQVKEPACQSTTGDTVVHICERNSGSGTAIYLDTFKAVNYQGSCTCQLSAQGGAVDLQLTVHGASSECDASLYFSPSIDHTYNCADKTPANTTGRIESGQMVYLTLTKGSDAVADFCVLLAQTSLGGSLRIYCLEGTPKPTTTFGPPVTSPSLPNSTDSGVTGTGSKGNTTSEPVPKTTSSSVHKPTSSERTTDHSSGSTRAPTQAPLHQTPAHSTIVVSIVVVAVFGAVVLLMIIMVAVKHCRKRSRSSKVAAAPSTANGLINVNL